ncbi:MAG: universal stress protein [SAR324 cluster bacterium]|nr:universal stress protein [SAR324 cluster bacterium]
MAPRYLVPVDFSPVSVDVVRFADQWAVQTKAEIWLLHVSQATYTYYPDRKQNGELLPQSVDDLKLMDWITALDLKSPVQCFHKTGLPYYEILQASRQKDVAAIIMAAHSHALRDRLFLGSNTDHVLHHATCPVFVYKKNGHVFSENIIVPVDYHEINAQVIHFADQWCQINGGTLNFIHVIRNGEGKESADMNFFEQKLFGFLDGFKIQSSYEAFIRAGKPYLEILALQEQINACWIMLAAHSHTQLDRLLMGSNTDYLAHNAKCPVYIFKQSTS